MSLPADFEGYRLAKTVTGYDVDYFCDNPAKNWDFSHYLNHHTTGQLTKRVFKKTLHNYKYDMQNLSKITSLPAEIRAYIHDLSEKEVNVTSLTFLGLGHVHLSHTGKIPKGCA